MEEYDIHNRHIEMHGRVYEDYHLIFLHNIQTRLEKGQQPNEEIHINTDMLISSSIRYQLRDNNTNRVITGGTLEGLTVDERRLYFITRTDLNYGESNRGIVISILDPEVKISYTKKPLTISLNDHTVYLGNYKTCQVECQYSLSWIHSDRSDKLTFSSPKEDILTYYEFEDDVVEDSSLWNTALNIQTNQPIYFNWKMKDLATNEVTTLARLRLTDKIEVVNMYYEQ